MIVESCELSNEFGMPKKDFSRGEGDVYVAKLSYGLRNLQCNDPIMEYCQQLLRQQCGVELECAAWRSPTMRGR